MIQNLLHYYGHPSLYLAVVGGPLVVLALILFLGERHRADLRKRKSEEAEENPVLPPMRGGALPTPRSKFLRPKNGPFSNNSPVPKSSSSDSTPPGP